MKQLKTIYIVAVLLAMTVSVVNAEIPVTSLNKDLIPPSPSSAVYKEYMGSRPLLSTGTVNIDIPLYEINYKGLDIPFSVTYRTNGIKVGDDPYPCGYGWIFNPGLRVTRTIMGRPDELFKWEIPATSDICNFEYQKSFIREDQYPNERDLLRDGEPDIFTINLPDESCTFVIDQRKGGFEPITINTNLKIELDITPYKQINEIKVTDGDGFIYHFTNKYTECLDVFSDYVTAWMLESITCPDGDSITFNWGGYNHSGFNWNEYNPFSLRDFANYENKDGSGAEIPDEKDSSMTGDYSYNGRHKDLQHLESVDFPGGSLHFFYEIKNYGPWLTKMEVRDFNSTIIKKAEFTYPADSSGALLRKLVISDEGAYTFDYYQEVRYDANNGNARDYWGYYNGKTGNKSLVPIINFKKQTSYADYGYFEYGNADRSVEPSYMVANMLKKVTYPTGGCSEYFYEPHRFNGKPVEMDFVKNNAKLEEGGGLRVTKVKSVNKENTDSVVWNYVYGEKEDGLAISLAEPTLDTFVQTYKSLLLDNKYNGHDITTWHIQYRQVWFNSYSDYLRYEINNTPIWYKEVTEYADKGKTVYRFSNPINRNEVVNSNYGRWNIQSLSTVWSGGPVLDSETVYLVSDEGEYQKIKETEYKYDQCMPSSVGTLDGFFVRRNIYNQMPSRHMNDFILRPDGTFECEGFNMARFSYDEDSVYYCSKYQIQPKAVRLSETVVRHFDSGKESEESTSFSYCGNRSLVKNKTVNGSDGRSIVEENSYPFEPELADAGQRSVLSAMTAANIVSTPFRTVVSEEGKSTVTEMVFCNYGGNLYLPEKETVERGGETSVTEYGYDSYGNIRSVRFNDDSRETYLWGYGGLYPVLYVKGLDFDEYSSLVGSQYTDLSQVVGSIELERKSSEIREKLTGKAAVSSFTYYPLVGMRTATVPDGRMSTYYYDGKGRLVKVVDGNNRTRSQYAYHTNGETLSVTIGGVDGVVVGTDAHIFASVGGGSDDYSYDWRIKDSGGSVMAYDKDGNGVNLKFSKPGSYVAEVTVKDNFTGMVATVSRGFDVLPVCLELVTEMKNDAAGTARLKVECPTPVTLNFYIYSQLYETGGEPTGIGSVSLSGCGNSVKYDFVEVTTKDVFYEAKQPGTVYIDIAIDTDSYGIFNVHFKGVDGSNGETFVSNYVQLEKPGR